MAEIKDEFTAKGLNAASQKLDILKTAQQSLFENCS
jgi:hypothetical protein